MLADLVLPAISNMSGMIVIGAPGGGNLVGIAELRANLLEQAALETAAQDVGHDFEGGIVLVFKFAAEVADHQAGLRDIGLDGDVNARFGLLRIDRGKWRHGRLLHGP